MLTDTRPTFTFPPITGNPIFAVHRLAQLVGDRVHAAAECDGVVAQAQAYHLAYQRVVRGAPGALLCPCSLCTGEFGG